MTLLIIGVVVWSIVHLFPAVLPDTRASAMERLGENTYKAVFSIALLVAIVLIVIGWRSAGMQFVYTPPLYGSPIIAVLMLISFILFAAASAPGNIKRFIRHPMLTGMIVWGAAHLLANGDERSIALFGGMSLWAMLEIVLISRREGAWQKAEAVALSKDAMTIVASAVIFAIVAYFHKFIFGVPAIAGL